MSPFVLIILLLLAQLLLSTILLFVALRLSRRQSSGQSISTYESDNALDTEDQETNRLPAIDHHMAWINQPTFHVLPAWPRIYEGPTHPHHAIKRQFKELY